MHLRTDKFFERIKKELMNMQIEFSRNQGSIFWSKTDIYSPPPPSEIYTYFSPKKTA
jgi:hypothetical protein